MPRMFYIPVLIKNRRNQVHSAYGVNMFRRVPVPRQLHTGPGASFISTKLAVCRIRSRANKSFFLVKDVNIKSKIKDIIISYSLDFLFLTETWLTEGSSAIVLDETAPVHFSCRNTCGTGKKGGRVAALCKEAFQCKEITFSYFVYFKYLFHIERCSHNYIF